MMKHFNRKVEEVNSGSMADIAFLLLIFFLVTTTIQSNSGLSMRLPPESKEITKVPIHERNLFNILINSSNGILVENENFENYDKLKQDVHDFILNNGRNPASSDNPEDAIISLKVNRKTSYKQFIEILDLLQGVYYQIYGERVGLDAEGFRNLDTTLPNEKEKYEKGREGIPMNISIAEPTHSVI